MQTQDLNYGPKATIGMTGEEVATDEIGERDYEADIRQLEAQMQGYREALRRRHQGAFDRMFADAKRHADAAEQTSIMDPTDIALFSMTLEQRVKIKELKIDFE